MRLFASAVFFALLAPASQAASITVGSSLGANVYPFSGYSGEYQQVYSAAVFKAPITITAISFY